MTSRQMSPQEKRAYLAELLRKKPAKPKCYPLSLAQERLWFLDKFEPGSSTYNMPAVIRMKGVFHQDHLEKAINEVVRRHEILRTTFAETEAGPVQWAQPFQPVSLKVVAINAPEEEQRKRQIQSWVEQVCGAPFNLGTGPLLRQVLLQVDAEDHVLISVVHHIVCDGWSLVILMQEIETLYAGLCAGKPVLLPELPIQYGDYAQWQRKSSLSDLDKQLLFWKDHLTGAPACLCFPTDFPRPEVQTYSGASLSFSVDHKVQTGLRRIAQDQEATIFMVLFAAFNVFLFRYTAETDLVVGTSIANRGRKEVQSLIGFFVNTLPLRLQFSGSFTFSQLVQEVRRVAVEAYAHQDVPFDRIVQELRVERAMSYSPLFQVMFDLNTTVSSAGEMKMSELRFNSVDSQNVTSKFDFTFAMEETGAGLGGMLEFNTDLFELETARHMIAYWQKLLDWLSRLPSHPLTEIPLLTAEQELLVSALETEATLAV